MRIRPALLSLSMLLACAPAKPRQVEIVATNYAFQVPDSLPPGPVTFWLANHGTVLHEVQIGRLRMGIGRDSGLRLLAMEDVPDSLFEHSGAVLVTSVGQTGPTGVTTTLSPGETWALICQFRDSAGAPPHDKLGMFKVLTVSGTRD